jgi:DNA-binding IclR family transcriptional regulator
VQTLERALAILDLFQPERPEWAAVEVARALDLTLPTASRVLRALDSSGLLMRVEGRRFRLGFGAVALGFRALRTIEVRERLHPLLVRLTRESGEACVLGVINEARDAAQVVDRVEGRDVIRISLDIGHAWPLHAGALAKVLLAHMPDRETILEQPLEKVGKNTITDREALKRELDHIRSVGWAASTEETEIGVWGVAKAVLDNHPVHRSDRQEGARVHRPAGQTSRRRNSGRAQPPEAARHP